MIKSILRLTSKKIKQFLKTDSVVLKIDFVNNIVLANNEPMGSGEFISNKKYIAEILETMYDINNCVALVLIDTPKEFKMEIYHIDKNNNHLKKTI